MLEKLNSPIIPVIVIDDANDALPLAEALLKGGLNVIEITFRTAAAAESIARIAKALPEMLVGAGTVITPEQAKRAIDSGSKFGLAPGLDTETVQYFNEQGVPFIPGVMTPSEIQEALKAGCKYMKFFPAGNAGGPSMLKALTAPYASSGVKFCPTGGVSLENMNDYLAIPQVFTVGGSWLATKHQITEKRWETITDQVKTALERAQNA